MALLVGLIREDELPRAHIHGIAVGCPYHLLDSTAGADCKCLPGSQVHQTLGNEEMDEDTHSIAAHFREGTVTVAVIHEPLRLGILFQGNAAFREEPGRNRPDKAVATDAYMAVAQLRHLLRR